MIVSLPKPKRYYVCDVIGCGTERDPYRAAVADYCDRYASVVPDGVGPRRALCAVRADSIVHSLLASMPNVQRLDDSDEIMRVGREIEPDFNLQHFGVWV